MKVLIIGSGAREHAVAQAFKGKEAEVKLYAAGKHRNPGIDDLAESYLITKETDTSSIQQFCRQNSIEMAFCGPEAPLAEGLTDALAELSIPTIGPTRQLARIESSKTFARQIVSQAAPQAQPDFWSFSSANDGDLQDLLNELHPDYVIKADGLHSGKGVKVGGSHLPTVNKALQWCHEIKGPFLVEQQLQGREFSLMSFTDGKTVKHMPVVQDYKRAFEQGLGPNTGGMGSISFADHQLPFLTNEDIQTAADINDKTVNALYSETGEYYQGVLYGGFIKTETGIKLIEYNCRLGDPEAINVISLMQDNFVQLCQSIVNHTLHNFTPNYDNQATVCKYLVPQGYPDSAVKGQTAYVNPELGHDLFYGSVQRTNNHDLTLLGSRAFAVLGRGATLDEAEQMAERHCEHIKGPLYHRPDIGKQ